MGYLICICYKCGFPDTTANLSNSDDGYFHTEKCIIPKGKNSKIVCELTLEEKQDIIDKFIKKRYLSGKLLYDEFPPHNPSLKNWKKFWNNIDYVLTHIKQADTKIFKEKLTFIEKYMY